MSKTAKYERYSEEFITALHGIPAHIVIKVLPKYVTGIDYSNCSKQTIAEAWASSEKVFGTEARERWAELDLKRFAKECQEVYARYEASAKPAETRLPCPGCGEPGRRPKDKVCHRCEKLLKFANQQAEIKAKKKQKWVRLDRDCDMPYISHHPWSPFTPEVPDVQRELNKMLLAAAIEEKKEHGIDLEQVVRRQTLSSSAEHCVLLNVDFIEAARRLYAAIDYLANHAYNEGKKDGTHLIQRLIEGDITNKEINESMIRSEREALGKDT